MNIKKLLIATLAVTAFNFIFGMLTCGWLFNWVYQLEPTNVWKPMENFPFALYIVSLLIVELIFVYVYALINIGIPGQNKVSCKRCNIWTDCMGGWACPRHGLCLFIYDSSNDCSNILDNTGIGCTPVERHYSSEYLQ